MISEDVPDRRQHDLEMKDYDLFVKHAWKVVIETPNYYLYSKWFLPGDAFDTEEFYDTILVLMDCFAKKQTVKKLTVK